jgi:hypothetical protein
VAHEALKLIKNPFSRRRIGIYAICDAHATFLGGNRYRHGNFWHVVL